MKFIFKQDNPDLKPWVALADDGKLQWILMRGHWNKKKEEVEWDHVSFCTTKAGLVAAMRSHGMHEFISETDHLPAKYRRPGLPEVDYGMMRVSMFCSGYTIDGFYKYPMDAVKFSFEIDHKGRPVVGAIAPDGDFVPLEEIPG